MRVEGEVLSPSFEHGQEADQRAQTPGFSRNRDERLGGGAEDDLVEDALVLLGDLSKHVGRLKVEMGVGDGQQLGFPLFQPLDAGSNRTPGAVPVAARVVSVLPLSARVAPVDVAAQHGRAADLDGRHHAPLLQRGLAGLPVGGSVAAKDVRKFKRSSPPVDLLSPNLEAIRLEVLGVAPFLRRRHLKSCWLFRGSLAPRAPGVDASRPGAGRSSRGDARPTESSPGR